VEGKNIVIEWRWAHARAERFPELATELVRLKVEVIVAANNPAVAAAQKATKTIPIVMVIVTDPVRLGFVTSLARPTGNITGLTIQSPELAGKRLQLLKEAVPHLTRVAVLWDPTEPGRRELVKETEAASPTLGLQLGERPSTRPEWSTRRPAPPAPGGSRRPGTRRSVQHGRRSEGQPTVNQPEPKDTSARHQFVALNPKCRSTARGTEESWGSARRCTPSLVGSSQ